MSSIFLLDLSFYGILLASYPPTNPLGHLLGHPLDPYSTHQSPIPPPPPPRPLQAGSPPYLPANSPAHYPPTGHPHPLISVHVDQPASLPVHPSIQIPTSIYSHFPICSFARYKILPFAYKLLHSPPTNSLILFPLAYSLTYSLA